MSRSTFTGPILAGDIRYAPYKDVGSVQLIQVIPLTNQLTSTTKTIYIPYNSRIININILTYASYAYNTTPPTLSIGSPTSATLYCAAQTLGVAANVSPIPTAQWRTTTLDITAATTGSVPVSALVLTYTAGTGGFVSGTPDLDVVIEYTQYDDRAAAVNQ